MEDCKELFGEWKSLSGNCEVKSVRQEGSWTRTEAKDFKKVRKRRAENKNTDKNKFVQSVCFQLKPILDMLLNLFL